MLNNFQIFNQFLSIFQIPKNRISFPFFFGFFLFSLLQLLDFCRILFFKFFL